MTWYECIIAAHTAVTDHVSHGGRMKSKRYFVWQEEAPDDMEAMLFSRAAVTNSLLSKFIPKKPEKQSAPKVPISQLDKRLSLLAH